VLYVPFEGMKENILDIYEIKKRIQNITNFIEDCYLWFFPDAYVHT